MGDKASVQKLCLERVKVDGIWCLLVTDINGIRAFLDHCSHKDVPLGPKVKIKKGCLRCPHHHVCFDPGNGRVVDAKGKKVPEGLIPVPVTAGVDGEVIVTLTAAHREYIEKRRKKGKQHT